MYLHHEDKKRFSLHEDKKRFSLPCAVDKKKEDQKRFSLPCAVDKKNVEKIVGLPKRRLSLPARIRRLSRPTIYSPRCSTPIQTIRIVMFGLGGVGKTSLIHRFLFNKFDSSYTATIEDDYRQVITYNNHIVDVTVLDTAGSFQFPAMRRHAIQHGHGFVLVYAVDNQASLEEAKRLYDEIWETKGSKNFSVILAGNKVDKSPLGKRKISRDDVNHVVDSWGYNAEHIETSAKLNHNVSVVFNKLIGVIDEKNMETIESTNQINNNFSKSTMRLPTTNKFDVRRTFSVDNNLDKKSQKSNGNRKKKMFLRKLFSRKTFR